MVTRLLAALALVVGNTLPMGTLANALETPRRISFTYRVNVAAILADAESALLWVPFPMEDQHQRLLGYEISGNYPLALASEDDYGNKFLRFDLSSARGDDANVNITFSIARNEVQALAPGEAVAAATPEGLSRFLEADMLVPSDGPFVEEARRVVGNETDPLVQARLLYDNLVDSVAYDKSGQGWGHGDALYACDVRAGNCTDFHSLFIAEARSLGIPARFTVGFPIPLTENSGDIGGYHCWAEFYAAGCGWIPIDASEAAKHPELRDVLFGTQPADRIAFTRGRDYMLPGANSGVQNYVIYPYIEVDGIRHSDVEQSFSFESQ
jgi:transglutaminase-like putative cysteine protease